MRFVVSFCLFLLLSSCQSDSLSHWFSQKKEEVTTILASQATTTLNEEDKKELLYLLADLEDAESCPKVQSYIERNKVLNFFEEHFKLPDGFLFDELINYDYEVSLLKTNRSDAETVTFSVISVWKTEVSLEKIKKVITKINKCYPDEYL